MQSKHIPPKTIHPVEDDRYFYNAEKAERPIRFIEKFCTHYEGKWAGQPFRLLDWQKEIIRKLFGWIDRRTGLRRFRQLYLITAKGAGKTPMLAAMGLYMLVADGEAGAHVISMASSFEQANLTFDAGKKYIAASTDLAKRITCQQHIIKAPKNSKWSTVSGKPNGRSGPRPSCVIADEVHEWPGYTADAFRTLGANLFKRSQPMLFVATNAGADKSCFAWSVHEKALGVIAGTIEDNALLPVIYEANGELDWRSEEAACAANPSIGEIVSFDQLKGERDNGEARYRRLFLSQWVTASGKWLDINAFDACVAPIPPDAINGLPLYVGVDLSKGDDLCAVVYVWGSEARYFVESEFWLPKLSADKYRVKEGINYDEWAAAGHVKLFDAATVNPEIKRAIATSIEAKCKGHNLGAVCYDRYGADECIAALEQAGITCVPIQQGWSVSPGTAELERRITDRSIQFAPNAVMRFCASNAEVNLDTRGNMWPVKPNAKGRYAGRRGAKIDGISAAVTAITECRKQGFKPVAELWSGTIEHFSC